MPGGFKQTATKSRGNREPWTGTFQGRTGSKIYDSKKPLDSSNPTNHGLFKYTQTEGGRTVDLKNNINNNKNQNIVCKDAF